MARTSIAQGHIYGVESEFSGNGERRGRGEEQEENKVWVLSSGSPKKSGVKKKVTAKKVKKIREVEHFAKEKTKIGRKRKITAEKRTKKQSLVKMIRSMKEVTKK